MNVARNVEYCVLDYVPNIVRDKSVSIAAIFIDACDEEKGTCTMTLAADWQTQVQLVDPNTDLEMVAAVLSEIGERLLSPGQRCEVIRQLEDSFSNTVRVSERRKCPVMPSADTIEAFARQILQKKSKVPPSLSATLVATCQLTL
jgi:hypothetical protein